MEGPVGWRGQSGGVCVCVCVCVRACVDRHMCIIIFTGFPAGRVIHDHDHDDADAAAAAAAAADDGDDDDDDGDDDDDDDDDDGHDDVDEQDSLTLVVCMSQPLLELVWNISSQKPLKTVGINY